VHAKQYYSLEVTFFKSSLDSHILDLLWNRCPLPLLCCAVLWCAMQAKIFTTECMQDAAWPC
jgi:hypothetical protein